MYKGYSFVFAEMSSECYGLFVADMGNKKHADNNFGNKANIVETRIAKRITPLHYGVRYHDQPLTFTLIFGSDEPLDRYQMQEVSNWLTGYQEYQWLSIEQPDMEHIQFRCIIQQLTPISVSWIPFAFEAQVICDCPYGYSYPFEESIQFNGRTEYRFYNDSTIKETLRPDLRIELASGCNEFSITNLTTGTVLRFSGLPAGGITILIDNENEVVTDSLDEYNLYGFFNFQFFELASGDNNLVITGRGKLVVSGRYIYNVGA